MWMRHGPSGADQILCVCVPLLLIAVALDAVLPPAQAQPLRADELLLIFNSADRDSRDLAEYYARLRAVPADRLCGLKVNDRFEEISPSDFEEAIRKPVRAYLEGHQLRDQVRCLVTFYGLPIRVGARKLSSGQGRQLGLLRRELVSVLDELRKLTVQMEALAQPGAAATPATQPPTEEDYAAFMARYAQVRNAALARLSTGGQRPESAQQVQQLGGLLQQAEGLAALLPMMQARPGDMVGQQRLHAVQQTVRASEARIRELMAKGVSDPARSEARELLRQNHGIVGLLLNLNADIGLLRVEETQASVDSELGLLWSGEYPRYRWINNRLNWRVRAAAAEQGLDPRLDEQPVMMTARIDAPTPQIARRMIDDAMAAERIGLQGNVYIDARGIKMAPSGHGQYDQYLRDLATLLWKHTPLTVRLDNRSEVFQQGQCPKAMLYCGWYSLRNYVDAFDFVPGAVAVHIASFEAISLKRRGERGWCAGLLADGASATVGPVAEPYLHSFPRPDDFFGLLLTGRFTLAEVYAYTSPLNSWMQMLLGDPLYRPFAKAPLLTLEQVFPPEVVPAEFRPAGGAVPGQSNPSATRPSAGAGTQPE
ncbi:MAG: hypothetical protein AMXMBFR13_51530 [Phycisphaerae bacterium]